MSTIQELVTDTVESAGCEVVQIKNHPKHLVRVLVDKEPGGPNVSDLAQITRDVNDAFEDAGLDPGEYTIEILSPGLDRPLVRAKDFDRFAGQVVQLKLKTKRSVDGRRSFKGKLIKLEDGVVFIENPDQPDAPWEISRGSASDIRLVPSFPKFKDPVNTSKRSRKPRKSRRKRPKDNR